MDPRACVEILAARGVQDVAAQRPSAPMGGQVIDLASGTVSRLDDTAPPPPPPPSAVDTHAAAAPTAAAHDSHDARELTRRFQSLQEERVRAYREYDDGLDGILRDRQLAAYPQLCAEATARFAALSRDINAVEERLRAADPAERAFAHRAADLVRRVQQLEKEKLELTAAAHLERIRETAGEELAASNLAYVRQRMGEIVASIVEQLDELRCELADY